MTGGLRVKNDRWQMYLQYKDSTGKYAQKQKSTGLNCAGNKRQAQKMLDEYMETMKYLEGLSHEAQEMTFISLFDLWIEVIESTKSVDIVTLEGYKSTIEKHLKPYFKSMKLLPNDVTTTILQKYHIYKSKHGRLDGKGGLSGKSLKQHHTVINQVMEYAISLKILTENPAQRVKKVKIEEYEADFYTPDEINTLLSVCEDEILKVFIYLSVILGTRRSETLGIKWNVISFEKKILEISHTVVKGVNSVVYKKDTTKNETSQREYPLTDDLIECFQNIKAKQENNKKLLGDMYQNSDYVFCWEDGHLYDPNNISRKFRLLLKKMGLGI